MRNLDRKKEIRQKIKELRGSLDLSSWQEKTDRITDTVIGQKWFQEAAHIYCYIDFGREVGTGRMIETAWKCGKKVWVPKVSGCDMQFYLLSSFDQLHPGTYGIMEPDDTVMAESKPGLMIVPGVAFDKNRNRIGYGKGYYDRFLSASPFLRTIAVAFDIQIVDEIKPEVQDIQPEVLITESHIYRSR